MAPVYKLTYFGVKGYGEPIRILLSYMGVEFEDVRITFEDWPALKPSTPFGKLPMLEIDGKTVCQSVSITRYLAKKAGLTGKDEWEDLNIDMAVDVCGDFMQEVAKFIREKDETLKAKILETLKKETLPFYYGKLDKLIEDNGGYLANKKLSWADIWVATLLDVAKGHLDYDMSSYSNITALQEKVFAIPSIKAWIDKRPVSL